jgi:hypothetical protein
VKYRSGTEVETKEEKTFDFKIWKLQIFGTRHFERVFFTRLQSKAPKKLGVIPNAVSTTSWPDRFFICGRELRMARVSLR